MVNPHLTNILKSVNYSVEMSTIFSGFKTLVDGLVSVVQ